MSYRCLDCSYKGTKFVNGACPACGSRNVQRIKQGEEQAEKPTQKPYRLIAMVLLWGVFIYELVKKLQA